MKTFFALALAFFSLQASASSAVVTEANVRAALNASPALVGALKEAKKMITPSTCRKLEIEITQTGNGSATIKVHGTCFYSGKGEGESASFFTLEGSMYDQKTLMVEKIEFGVAG